MFFSMIILLFLVDDLIFVDPTSIGLTFVDPTSVGLMFINQSRYKGFSILKHS